MRPKRTVEVAGAVVEFLVVGAGDPVVLLPGGGFDGSYFGELAQGLAGAGFCAVAVNPRGAGGSAGSLDGLTLHTLAADVAAVIEALEGGPVHVLSHGFSNRVTRCLVADRPDLVRSVILLAGVGLVEPDAEVVRALRAWFRHDSTESECLEAMRCLVADPSTAERLLRSVTRWPVVAAAQAAADRATPRDEWQDAAIRAPVLVVQGLADRVAPPEHGRTFREQFGDRIRVVELPRAGHMVFLEQPEAVAEAVVTFLREQAA